MNTDTFLVRPLQCRDLRDLTVLFLGRRVSRIIKIESLDNTILVLWLAQSLWYMSRYTMLSLYGNCTRLLKIKNKIYVICWLSSRCFCDIFVIFIATSWISGKKISKSEPPRRQRQNKIGFNMKTTVAACASSFLVHFFDVDSRGAHLGIFWVGMCRPWVRIGIPF